MNDNNASAKQLVRLILIGSLVLMAGLVIFELSRGNTIPVFTAIFIVGWVVWVFYMLFRSKLFKTPKA